MKTDDVFAEMKQALGPIDREGFERAAERARQLRNDGDFEKGYPHPLLDGTLGFYPIADNPQLVEGMETREVKVTCSNNHQYVFLQEIVEHPEGFGMTGARPFGDESVLCPTCEESIAEALAYAMHSAGFFNAQLWTGN